MRDYKGSGSFSFKKRRRFPRALGVSIVLLIAAAVGGYLIFIIPPAADLPGDETATPALKPSSGRDVIPLVIPGQKPKQAAEGDS